ncbi:MAG TPA: hypothetical protein VND19_12765 [Acetobacteraceae bacterium]|nr:hypothetical protein [Acetobacteraceae bacterium]
MSRKLSRVADTLPGTPVTTEPSGTCIPGGTSAIAPTTQRRPGFAPSITVPMPTRRSSPISTPCTTARCAMEQ